MDIEQARELSNRAREAWYERRIHDARKLLDEAIGLDPENPAYYVSQGMVLGEIGDYSEASKAFESAHRMLSGRPDLVPVLEGPLLHNRALLSYRLGQYEHAIELYERAVALFAAEGLSEHRRMALQNLAWTCTEAGYVDRVPDLLNQAYRFCKAQADRNMNHLTEAYLLVETERGGEALPLLERVSTIDQSLETQSLVLAIGALQMLRLGRKQEARSTAIRAWTLATGDNTDKRAFCFVQRVLNRISRAIAEGA